MHRDAYLLLKRTRLPEIDFQKEQLSLIKRVYRRAKPDADELETLVFSTLAQTLADYCIERDVVIDPAELMGILHRIL